MTYRGDSRSYIEMEPSSDWSGDGDALHFSIGDTEIGILLMVP